MSASFSFRRLWALCKKESFQIVQDPTSIIIAFILPAILLVIFGFGLSFDANDLRVGVVMEDTGPEARDFVSTLEGSSYISLVVVGDRNEMERAMTVGAIRAFVVIPADFARQVEPAGRPGTDPGHHRWHGAEYGGILVRLPAGNLADLAGAACGRDRTDRTLPLAVEPRYWYNPAAISRNYLIPASITIIMTIIGALLTSLVVAREWERGTMEALLSTPVTRGEIILSKLLPYYALGMAAFIVCVSMAVTVFGVPFRGIYLVLRSWPRCFCYRCWVSGCSYRP